MSKMTEIRTCLLEVIRDQAPKSSVDGNLQSGSVLSEVQRRLGGGRGQQLEQGILTAYHDLFRTGYLAWGLNLANPSPPFFHITDQGRKSLANLSRDPGNPDGYLGYLQSSTRLNPIAASYIKEAVNCFVQDLPKASAVMVGAASESIALELRDAITARLQSLGKPAPKGLNDWRIKVILDAMQKFLDQNSGQMPRDLSETFGAYWSAFLQQIRSARNDAGHPVSVDPVTYDTVHASLLIFPELARLGSTLTKWVSQDYK